MWVFVDNVSWNSDVMLGMDRETFSEYEPFHTHYKHLEDRGDIVKALEQTYDIINETVNGKKIEKPDNTVSAKTE